jgi:hypothetical protein
VDPKKASIAYCRIGERSSHTWFVLKYLPGIASVKNYDGSWTEYGNLIGAPIEKPLRRQQWDQVVIESLGSPIKRNQPHRASDAGIILPLPCSHRHYIARRNGIDHWDRPTPVLNVTVNKRQVRSLIMTI